MKRLTTLFVLCATASVTQVLAQTVETIPFRGVMLTSNEVPPATVDASATAAMAVHVVRDASGKITSGSVDFRISYAFPAGTVFTGLHIHKERAGANGDIVIATDVANVPADTSGRGLLVRQAQVLANDAKGLDALNGILQDPSQFYVNIHTTEFRGGAARAQLQRADLIVLMGQMTPANQVPAILDLNASGLGAVYVYGARDASGAITSGQVIFDVLYNFPTAVTFTGLHIHDGGPTVAGPVTISSGVGSGAASVMADPSGSGRLLFQADILPGSTDALNTLRDLFVNPGAHYINLHTVEFPGGVIRAQLRRTDRTDFNVIMLPSNETPPITGLDASAPAKISAWTLRGSDGAVTAGVVAFDVDHRFPGKADFTGLHIHDQVAGQAGAITINPIAPQLPPFLGLVPPTTSDTGFGNLFTFIPVSGGTALASLNSLLTNPERHYVNLHTMVNPGGAIRAQLGGPFTGTPTVSAAVSAALSTPPTTSVAPGGLLTIFGSNMTKVTATLNGFAGNSLPTALNGVQLTIGGRAAPLIYVSPTQINAQVPVDVPAGAQPVVVKLGDVSSQSSSVTVAAFAPAIFQANNAGVVLKNADFSLVSSANPAKLGDILLIYSTGLGQTTPALTTGTLVGGPPFSNTAATTVTIGGQNADVIYSIAAPSFAGLYQTAVRVPSGLSAGNSPIVLTIGGARSAAVNLAVSP